MALTSAIIENQHIGQQHQPSHGNNICHYWKINGKSLKIIITKLFRHTFSNTYQPIGKKNIFPYT